MQNGFMNFSANASNIGAMVRAAATRGPWVRPPLHRRSYSGLQAHQEFRGRRNLPGGQYNGTNPLAAPSGGQIDAANITGAIGTTQASINAYLARLGSSTRLSEFFSGLETSDNGKGLRLCRRRTFSTGRVFGQGQKWPGLHESARQF